MMAGNLWKASIDSVLNREREGFDVILETNYDIEPQTAAEHLALWSVSNYGGPSPQSRCQSGSESRSTRTQSL